MSVVIATRRPLAASLCGSDDALKSSVRVLFRNLPALEGLELRSVEGIAIGSVEVPKKKTDTVLTTSLVIAF